MITGVDTTTRRARQRAATVVEIKATARDLLVRDGAANLSLRAIGREIGMTAPGLYRYFASREDLVQALVADLYDELCGEIEAARDARDEDDTAGRLLDASRAFRKWSLRHRAEFELIFGSEDESEHSLTADDKEQVDPGVLRFTTVYGELIGRLYAERPFPIRPDEELEPELREQLLAWCSELPVPMPLGLLEVFLRCWIQLYGAVTLEVFGHLRFALSDAEPMFESVLRGCAEWLGVADLFDGPREAGR